MIPLMYLVTIDPVQQEDSDESSPPGQCCTWVTVWCSGVAILCVMYLMVELFALNHAGNTTVHTRVGTSSVLPGDLHIWGLSSQCASRWFLNVCTVLLLTTSLGRSFQVVVILMGKKCCVADVLNRFIFSII